MLAIFGGNMGAYGQDTGDGSGGMRVDKPLTAGAVRSHLQGHIGIGCYPSWHQDGELWTKWGCCDIDTGDWSEAYSLAVALRSMGFVPHVERSRSKGWHIWIFATKKVPARAMRRALKVAYAAIELPAREANPKSEHLRAGQVGNYVRLPYKGALGEGGNPFRQTFLKEWDANGDGRPVGCTDWMFEFDTGSTTNHDLIEYWADKYVEPKRVHLSSVPVYDDGELEKLLTGLRGELLLAVKARPVEDRSRAMVSLAYRLRAAGYTSTEVFNILKVTDEHWGGKYASRENRDDYLLDIVERVW